MEFSNFEIYSNKIIDEYVYNMETKGFHLIENFLNETTCNILKEKLKKVIDNYEAFEDCDRSKLDRFHMHDLLCKDVIFSKILEDPRIDQIISKILGEFWILYAFTSSTLPPNGNNYGSRIHVDSPRIIPGYPTNLGVIWTLDEFTEENGGTHILPGSHNTKTIPSEEIFNKNHQQILCKKGSLIIFNARLWHRAGENKTNKFRHALTMNVCRPFMKQRFDWVRFIPISISNQLNSQARRIIGFDTRLPSSLEDFFQKDEKRLYKNGQE